MLSKAFWVVLSLRVKVGRCKPYKPDLIIPKALNHSKIFGSVLKLKYTLNTKVTKP